MCQLKPPSRHPVHGDVAAHSRPHDLRNRTLSILDETGSYGDALIRPCLSFPQGICFCRRRGYVHLFPSHSSRIIRPSMPSFPDTAVLVLLALLLFGPKKLPVLARQLGKLMADFRRASNEFRTQMEEELRISEQADRQKQVAATEAAAPTPAIDPVPEPDHPHLPPPEPTFTSTSEELTPDYPTQYPDDFSGEPAPNPAPTPIPIETSGELSIIDRKSVV